MSTDRRVVLDACVLVPMPLADTLLRMAEEPRLYVPQWTQTIMDEVTRTLIGKWELRQDAARRREDEIRRHFPEAFVEGFEALLNRMTNEQGDRHVLAAAVHSRSELIVTYNRRHFPPDSLKPWKIEIRGPSTFLRGLYETDPNSFVTRLQEQANAIGTPLPRLLRSLARNAPAFVESFCRQQGIGIRDEQDGS